MTRITGLIILWLIAAAGAGEGAGEGTHVVHL